MRETLLSLTGISDAEVSDSDDSDDDKMMMIITHRDGLCGVALADDGQRAGSGAHSAGGRRGEAENVGNKRLLRLVHIISVAYPACMFLFRLLSPARLLGTRTKPLSCSASGLELGLCLLGPVCACAGLSALSLVSILVTRMNILLCEM